VEEELNSDSAFPNSQVENIKVKKKNLSCQINSVKKAQNIPYKRPPLRTVIYILYAQYVFPHLIDMVTYLTRYFPFSKIISENYFMHYANRDHVAAKDIMGYDRFLSRRLFIIESQDRDQYFYYLTGHFDKAGKEKDLKELSSALNKRFGAGNVYMDELDLGHYTIKITRSI